MKKLSIALSSLALCFSVEAGAAEPASLYVIKSVNIDAPATAAWNKLARFGDLGAWHPAVKKTEITDGADGESGATRALTLQDGGKIREKLTAYDQGNKTMSYVIIDGVLPVAAYASTLHVHPNGANKSVVVWEAHFQAQGVSDQAASDIINSVYDGGLGNLKKILE